MLTRRVMATLEITSAPDVPIRIVHIRQWQWRTSVLVWCLWASRVETRRASLVPSVRQLYAVSGGMLDWRAQEEITNLLHEGGVIYKTPKRVPCWVGGWNVAQLRRKVRLGQIALPYPTESDPPTAFLTYVTDIVGTVTDSKKRLGQFKSDYN